MTKLKTAELITTFFYIGKIPYCPGTFGALAAYLLTFIYICLVRILIIYLPFSSYRIAIFCYITAVVMFGALVFALLFIGVRYSNIYINYTKVQDPKEIVIDEVAGQLLTIMLSSPCLVLIGLMGSKSADYISYLWFIITFITFRLFDIFKPWPINLIDKNVKGGLGVMLDDIVAALFASVTTYVVIFLLI